MKGTYTLSFSDPAFARAATYSITTVPGTAGGGDGATAGGAGAGVTGDAPASAIAEPDSSLLLGTGILAVGLANGRLWQWRRRLLGKAGLTALCP